MRRNFKKFMLDILTESSFNLQASACNFLSLKHDCIPNSSSVSKYKLKEIYTGKLIKNLSAICIGK
jgi:hypothetical protein